MTVFTQLQVCAGFESGNDLWWSLQEQPFCADDGGRPRIPSNSSRRDGINDLGGGYARSCGCKATWTRWFYLLNKYNFSFSLTPFIFFLFQDHWPALLARCRATEKSTHQTQMLRYIMKRNFKSSKKWERTRSNTVVSWKIDDVHLRFLSVSTIVCLLNANVMIKLLSEQ